MMFRSVISMVVLAATAGFAQSTPPGSGPGGGPLPTMGQRRALPGRGNSLASQNQNQQGTAALRQRIDDMQSTLTLMHTVLKKMQARQAKSGVKDSLAKANLDLWGLMVGHLDSELKELQTALAVREDMDARRAALYKQADAKAEAEAQKARAAQVLKFADAAAQATETPSATPSAGQTAPAQSSSAPASNSTSPN